MAHPDRQFGMGGQPDTFASIVGGLADLQHLSTDFRGLAGNKSDKVAQWDQGGLGRRLGVVVLEPGTKRVVQGRFRTLAYAIPRTDEHVKGSEQQSVVVFGATEEQGESPVLIVGPKQLQGDGPAIVLANRTLLDMYDTVLEPFSKPAVVPGWITAPEKSPVESFIDSSLPFLEIHPTRNLYIPDLVAEAEANAQRIRARRNPAA